MSKAKKQILIVDTKAGNLFSLKAALQRLNFDVTILDRPPSKRFDGIVIPGQGRFGTVIDNITQANWPEYFTDCKKNNIPMLGICVGMQIFFEASDEDPSAKGLAWFKGRVQSLDFPKKPMVGWADLNTTGLAKQWPKKPVYFVNSFAIRTSNNAIATTQYGENFCAAIASDNFVGVQFHPEKSSFCGSKIIEQVFN